MTIPWKAHAFALLVTLPAVALTWLTWPFFSPAPFAPVFGAVAIASHWGGSGPGLLSIAVGAAGLAAALPGGAPFAWNSPPLVVFVAIGLVGSRLIAGRNKATAALRESEARLRATLEEMRASEERLRRAQKMEAVGQLAAGVAHNFNNLLQVTMGYTDILMDEDRDRTLDGTAIEEIRRATERGASLTRQLLAFGRRHDSRVACVDLNQSVRGLREMLTRVVREDITLTFAFADGRAETMIDPYDVEQVIFNLVLNARDAMPSGGAIGIEVDRTTADAGIRHADQPVSPGEYVRLRVRDNGVGMTPEVQAHLFEPFFTTKDVGEGTGLGLAFIHGIARQAHGFVTIDSALGTGTTVSVYLPLAAASAVAPEARPAGPVRAGSLATILLVEDENAVRKMTSQMLMRAGYKVLDSSSAAEACVVFEEHAADIDLLLTDVVMPDMHGPALAERLLAARPRLPVVFMSGYSDAMPEPVTPRDRTGFVPKPFSASQLITAIEGALSSDLASR